MPDAGTRRRRLAAGLAVAGGGALVAALAARQRLERAPSSETALEGRVGSPVGWFDARFTPAPGEPTGRYRRIFRIPEGRLLLDLTEEARVRQFTLGRERATNDTFSPEPGDWSLEFARGLARPWLPRDAAAVRTEPFLFRGEVAGLREVFRSPALQAAFPAPVYTRHGAVGPPGLCAITYYQTSAAGVAFLLVGLY